MANVKPAHDFGSALRARRERAGLSQRALARLSGVGTTTVCRIESNAAASVHPETIEAIEAALSESHHAQAAATLPPLLSYLRVRYPHMPEHLVREVADYFDYLTDRYGHQASVNGADER